jgi:hypothetical protein
MGKFADELRDLGLGKESWDKLPCYSLLHSRLPQCSNEAGGRICAAVDLRGAEPKVIGHGDWAGGRLCILRTKVTRHVHRLDPSTKIPNPRPLHVFP